MFPDTEVATIAMIRKRKLQNDTTVQPKLVVNEGLPEAPDEGSDAKESTPCPKSPEHLNANRSDETHTAVGNTASTNSANRISCLDIKQLRYAPGLMLIYGVLLAILLGPAFIRQHEKYNWADTFAKANDAYRQKNLPKAHSLFFEAGTNAKALYGTTSDQYLSCLTKLRWVFEDEQNFSAARKVLVKLTNMSSEDTLNFKIDQVITYPSLLRFDKPLSQFDKYDAAAAKHQCTEYIELMRPYMGDISPGLVKPYSMLAKGFRFEKDYPASEKCLATVLKIRLRSQGHQSVGAAEAKVEIGDLYLEWGHHWLKTGQDTQAVAMFAQAAQQYTEAAELLKHLASGSFDFDTLNQKKEIAEKQVRTFLHKHKKTIGDPTAR